MVLISNGTGTETVVLMNNPQFSFFKTVFKRYTNFATEPIEVPLAGSNTLKYDSSVTLKCVIPRHADLLSHLYLLVDLPDIFSGYRPPDDPSDYPDAHAGYHFKWIRELGTRMIESVDITVGGTLVQQLKGDWIALWYEMFAPTDIDTSTYHKMTGNVPEMYDPANTPHAMGVYPTSTLVPSLNKDPELRAATVAGTSTVAGSGTNITTNPYYRTASIPGRTLYVPLPFWFATQPGAAFPLVALQNHEVEVHVTLRRLRDLYTVRDTRPESDTYGSVGPPMSTDDSKHAIGRFLAASSYEHMVEGASLGLNDELAADQNLVVTPRLLAGYVFLSDAEQMKFATSQHQYLIEQINYRTFSGIYGTKAYDLTLNHAVKTLVWYAQRDDVKDRNDWTNYTNHVTPGGITPDTSLRSFQPATNEMVYRRIGNTGDNDHHLIGFTTRVPNTMPSVHPVTKFNFRQTSPSIISDATLLFNGVELFHTQKSSYFEMVQPLQCQLRRNIPGVYSYSFALNPRNARQPSGACDTSRVNQVQLQVETVDRRADGDVDYTLNVIVVRYNVLRFMGGMAGLAFAN